MRFLLKPSLVGAGLGIMNCLSSNQETNLASVLFYRCVQNKVTYLRALNVPYAKRNMTFLPAHVEEDWRFVVWDAEDYIHAVALAHGRGLHMSGTGKFVAPSIAENKLDR